MSACHHINTNLELESVEDLTPIVQSFGNDVVVLFHGEAMGRRRASFEVAGLDADPDTLVNHFCTFAEALSEPEKGIWHRCSTKVFDIRYECGISVPAYRSELRSETVSRVAALGASIVVTLYPPVPSSPHGNGDA